MSAAEHVDSTIRPLIDEEVMAKYEIHKACQEGLTKKVELLLADNPKLINRFDQDGRLPIHWAVAYNRQDIVKKLMDNPKFDIDVTDELGWTLLMIACARKEGDDLVELILSKGPNVDLKNHSKQTAIHLAASKDRARVVEMLLEKKASVLIPDQLSRYPIHRAAAAGSIRVLRILLTIPGQINRVDREGLTPLHHAIAEGHVDAAIVLIEAGADTAKKNTEGRLPIQMTDDMEVLRMIGERTKAEGIDITLPNQ